MAKSLQRSAEKKTDTAADLWRLSQEYLRTRAVKEATEGQEKRYKAHCLDQIAEQCEPDENGHRTYRFPTSIPLGDREVLGLKRERRAPQMLNAERAMALIKEKGLVKECTEVISYTQIDEDALLRQSFSADPNTEPRISDEELQGLYDESESFAMVLIKGEKIE